MRLAKAEQVGREVIAELAAGCERVVVAGSTRRRESECGDVEIVYIPAMEHVQTDLFTIEPRPLFDRALANAMARDVLVFDNEIKRNGNKHKRLIHVDSGMVVDTFAAEHDNWGLVLMLRTGPVGFCKLIVNRFGGAMPLDMEMRGGYLWRRGERLSTPTEEKFFDEMDLPFWPPEERSGGKLLWWLRRNGRA